MPLAFRLQNAPRHTRIRRAKRVLSLLWQRTELAVLLGKSTGSGQHVLVTSITNSGCFAIGLLLIRTIAIVNNCGPEGFVRSTGIVIGRSGSI